MRARRLVIFLATPAAFAFGYMLLWGCGCPTPRTCADQFCACVPVVASIRPDPNLAQVARDEEPSPELMCLVEGEVPY